jgi:hypothetical protein
MPGELLESGLVTRLHDELYARLPHGRMVLIGGPGAGKTGAMILLLLAALDRRAGLTCDQRSQVPVPVWLTLGGWNPVTTALHEWAIATINRDHPALLASDYGPDVAAQLLDGGWIALFLDGLDEVPNDMRARILQRIDIEARGLRVVITSRAEEYRATVQAGSPDNTAVIEVRPVRPTAAAAYLLRNQTGDSRQRWEQIGAYLRQHPKSIAAHALDNPLYLSLARDAYVGKDPTELIKAPGYASVTAMRKHLIEQVLITAYPDEQQRVQASRWLAWIAGHMGRERDLPWWTIPTWIARRQLRLAAGLVVGLVAGLGFGLAAGLQSTVRIAIVTACFFGLTAGLLAGFTSIRFRRGPTTLVVRRPRRRELVLSFVIVLGPAVFGGLEVGLAARLLNGHSAVVPGIWFGLIIGVGVGVGLGLRRLWATPMASSPAATAANTYSADRLASIVYALIVGLVFGVGGWLANGIAFHSSNLFRVGFGLTFGIVTALGFWLGAGQFPLVKLAELVLACQRHGKVQFARLLEDAFKQGVLRQAGTVYQFRHATLQDHLATIYSNGLNTPYLKVDVDMTESSTTPPDHN